MEKTIYLIFTKPKHSEWTILLVELKPISPLIFCETESKNQLFFNKLDNLHIISEDLRFFYDFWRLYSTNLGNWTILEANFINSTQLWGQNNYMIKFKSRGNQPWNWWLQFSLFIWQFFYIRSVVYFYFMILVDKEGVNIPSKAPRKRFLFR